MFSDNTKTIIVQQLRTNVGSYTQFINVGSSSSPAPTPVLTMVYSGVTSYGILGLLSDSKSNWFTKNFINNVLFHISNVTTDAYVHEINVNHAKCRSGKLSEWGRMLHGFVFCIGGLRWP